MARKMKDIDTEEELVETFTQADADLKGRVRNRFLKVLIRHFLVSECQLAERSDAKVEEVGPLVRRCVSATHHPHALLAQHLFSVIVAHCRMMCCTAPLCQAKGHTLRTGHRADTRHFLKLFVIFLFFPVFFFACVSFQFFPFFFLLAFLFNFSPFFFLLAFLFKIFLFFLLAFLFIFLGEGGRVTRVTVGRDTKVFDFVRVNLATLKVAARTMELACFHIDWT